VKRVRYCEQQNLGRGLQLLPDRPGRIIGEHKNLSPADIAPGTKVYELVEEAMCLGGSFFDQL